MNCSNQWKLDPFHKETIKLNDQLSSLTKKLYKTVIKTDNEELKYQAVYAYYRKYYGLTLVKNLIHAGINRSPTRDIVLDFPWKELKLDRINCLKIWEKINH